MIESIRKPSDSAPNRLGALAKLPLFFELSGRKVVVAGGTAAAAWKAELLAAAGGDVAIYAMEVEAEMSALLTRGAAGGSLTLHLRRWSEDDFAGAVLAIADLGTGEEARAFCDCARRAGANVNIIDKPAYCDFQFGTIVNRSPVVVGISTDGAAPILGQAIRRRIETLLPPSLAKWAAIAKDIRGQVGRVLKAGKQRRAFWEHFSEKAFGAAPAETDHGDLIAQISSIDTASPHTEGRVTLVGAGPGHAELLTLKAVRTLQSADVILFDDLVSDDVLELARREAKRMMVGKRGGRASCAQGDINALMVKLARQGKHVVRLKSGDPMIFGRAGEEIAELRSHGITVGVVPGITSASAMASALTVSLTHRQHAHSVRFVTGHSRDGELPEDLDWQGLADPETSLVFYMGARTASRIADKLIAAGLAPDTPAVIVSAVTRPEERRWQGALCTLGTAIGTFDLSAPVILGIGRVFHADRQIELADDAPTVTDLVRQRSAL
ncbi:MAG: siroheme synthase CysG [Hyphomicrobiaceae bacterium]